MTLEYGQKLPAPAGVVVDVAEGRAVENIDVALPPAGAITGRVTDDLGDPIERATVTAMRMGYSERGPRLVRVGKIASTNDAGEYRIAHLQPGEYFVVAAERSDGFGSQPDADIGLLKTAHPAAADLEHARLVAVNGSMA